MNQENRSIAGFDRSSRASRTRKLGLASVLAAAAVVAFAMSMATPTQAATVIDIEAYESRVGRAPGWLFAGVQRSRFDITNSDRGIGSGHFTAPGCTRPGGCPGVESILANARSVVPGETVRATDTFGGAVIDGTPSLFGFSETGVTGWYEASWENRSNIGYVIIHNGAFDTTAAPITVVPEPTTGLLCLTGLALFGAARPRRR